MKQNYKIVILWLLFVTSLSTFATEYTVSSHQEFNALTLVAGDVVIWENGTYSDEGNIKFLGQGTEDNPIILKAETPGRVIFTGGMTMDIGGSYLVVDGFYWKGGVGASNFIEFRSDPIYSDHCTLQNCVIDGLIIDPDDLEEAINPTDPEDSPSIPKHRWVVLHGNYNNVLNCAFMNKASAGALVLVELEYNAFSNGEDDPTSVNTRSIEVGHTISNNYFFNYEKIDASLSNAGDSETIRVGTSEYQNVNCATTVSNNYFVQADGENEIISNKSRNNKYINNTFRRSRGSLVLRHGAGATVEGNVFLGEGVEGTGGLRIVDSDHTITNNYIQNCINVNDQAKWNNPITIMGGNDTSVTDPNTTSVSNGYQKTENIVLSNNTIVNSNAPIFFNGAKGKNDTKGTVSNNLIYYDADSALKTAVITGDDADSFSSINELTYSGNVFNNTVLGESVTGFTETSMTITENGEIFNVAGAAGKGASLGGYTPITDDLVGNGIGACFLDAQGGLVSNPNCVIEGVEPVNSLSIISVADFSASEGEVATEVISNIAWTAVSNDDWVTIDIMSGDGNADITVSVAQNEAFESRTGTVTFTEVDGTLERVLSVTQNGAQLTDLYTLINTGEENDPVTIEEFSKQQVGFDDGAERFNYAANTLDKDPSTRWAANDLEDIPSGSIKADGEFIIYDLGDVYDLGLIQLSSDGKTDAYGYQIWTSESGFAEADFTKLFPLDKDIMLTVAGSSEFQQTEVSVNARYVKLIGFGRFDSGITTRKSFWTNITEIEFFGKQDSSLSVIEEELNEVVLYPVPTKETLYLKNLAENITKLEIVNLAGKTVLTKSIENTNNVVSMDVAGLASGVYVLRISNTNNVSVSKKVIIQ